MNNRYVIADTCDVTWERIRDGKIVMTTESQLASISQAVSEERIYGGIGGGTVALISSQKEIDLSVRDALWMLDYLEMTQGVEINSAGTATITKKLEGKVADNAGTLEVTIDNTTVTEGVIVDKDGSQNVATFTTGVADLPLPAEAKDGDTVVVYIKEEVTGDMVTFSADKFSELYKCTYRTIAFDPSTMEHKKDIVIQFDSVKPSGSFDMSFEMNSPIAPEMNFTVLTPMGKKEMGRILVTDPI
ncbi:hypothetical protein [Sporosarcina sp. FSL W7-1283]|uniref:hypothetical protein n=1 Tax=Sporosarcina sp. FSL W7-1283 TaxID=2921560 RepID=UPI0030F756BF